MELLRSYDVMDIAPATGEEAPVFPAAKRYPDPIFGHRDLSSEPVNVSLGSGISTVRPSRQPLRGFLRMRTFLNAIKDTPHAEERLKGASRSTHKVDAALALVRWLR
jgi:hypothetical protein